MFLRLIVATVMLFGAAAPAQVTSYTGNNPPPLKGDGDRIVCKKQEKIGTRLGARKVCLTVNEWLDREQTHQQQIGRMQSGACVPDGPAGGGGCLEGPGG